DGAACPPDEVGRVGADDESITLCHVAASKMSHAGSDHSTLIPASSMMRVRVADSLSMKPLNSSEEPGSTEAPRFFMVSTTSGSLSDACSALFNVAMTSSGVPAGATSPHHTVDSTSTPKEAAVLRSGRR